MAALDRPHYVRDELLGPDAWRRLVARYGGGDYKIPVSVVSLRGQALAELIGTTLAQRLIDYGAGCEIYVHAGHGEVLAARYAEIRAMRDRGMTLAEIASRTWPMRYTERSIRDILNRGGEGFPPVEEGSGPA